MGFQPVNVSVQFYGNAVYPAGGFSWSMHTQVAFLFHKFWQHIETEMKPILRRVQMLNGGRT